MSEHYPFFIISGAQGPEDQPEQRTPVEAPEGVSGQFIETETGLVRVKRAVSLTQIRTLDLLSEGPIGGLVSGEYSYVGVIGEIGYRSARFIPYPAKTVNGRSLNFLRSIYWNEVPVVDKDGLFNFQQIDVSATEGGPNGSEIGGEDNELTYTRLVSERLRGPNSTISRAGDVRVVGEVEQFAKTYRILNKDCRACNINVRVNALSESIVKGEKAGDVIRAGVFYRIYYKPIFSTNLVSDTEQTGPDEQFGFVFAKQELIQGKISYGYIRSTRIDFDSNYTQLPNFIGWAVKIFRLTPDSVQSTLRNQTYIDSLTEIYGDKFCYPNSAIVSAKFSAEYFNQVPNRAFDVRLLKVKVPSNYDEITRTYNGIWDGTWKTDHNGNIQKVWTDNPAWCFYDLITNPRYGLGKYLDENLVDKWTLYEISKYCDTLVSDGLGGIEPRFTCNFYINSREEAYRVINDMASIFRAVIYYSAGTIFTSQDVEKNPVFQFTNANVEEGNFSYSSSSKRVRHSVAIVRYNDKTEFYKPAIEYVEDVEAIKKYGVREVDITAIGCTSRGQALRLGRWALISEGLETETVSFTAGMEGVYLRPGDVFQVFDSNKHQCRHGGRTLNIDNTTSDITVRLDSEVTGLRPNGVYRFSLLTPTFNYEVTQVSGLNSATTPNIRRAQIQTVPFYGSQASGVNGYTEVTFRTSGFGTNLDFGNYHKGSHLVWMIEASGENVSDPQFINNYEMFRVIRIEEKDENRYTINGVQYDGDKFNAIESGLNFQAVGATIPLPPPVQGIKLENVNVGTDLKGIRYTLEVSNYSGVNSFLVYAKQGPWVSGDFSERFQQGQAPVVLEETPDSRYLINILPANRISGIHIPTVNGDYYFRAYSRNSQAIPCLTPASATISLTTINPFQNFTIQGLRLSTSESDSITAQRTGEEYTASEPTFNWQAGFKNVEDKVTVADVTYRITFRKSVDASAINPATGGEWPDSPDRYKPSNVIYYEVNNYIPENLGGLAYTFEIENNIQAFTDYWLGQGSGTTTGLLREYDVVVEAHLDDGTSSAGGNISGLHNGIQDSDFSNKEGYDILYVRNPSVPAITLTNSDGLAACLVSANNNPDQICTDQWINNEGQAKISLERGSLPSDTIGGYIFTCPESFAFSEAITGQKNNGTPIEVAEFQSLVNPLSAESNLFGYRSGYMAVALYDTFDDAFRTEALKENENFSLVPYLNMSNVVQVGTRGVFETDKFKYRAWWAGYVNYTIQRWQPAGGDPYRVTLNFVEGQGVGIQGVSLAGVEVTSPGSVEFPQRARLRFLFEDALLTPGYGYFYQVSKGREGLYRPVDEVATGTYPYVFENSSLEYATFRFPVIRPPGLEIGTQEFYLFFGIVDNEQGWVKTELQQSILLRA